MKQDKPPGQQPKGGNPDSTTDAEPTLLPREGWSKLSREERANSVWSWLNRYRGAHWWTGTIDERQIAAWILFMEGSTLGPVDREHMAQGIRAFIHDNDFKTMLAAMTSFINPDRGSSFTQTDWQLLTNPGEDMTPYLDIVNDVWDDTYDPNWSNYKFWFDASEMAAVNVNEAMLADLGSYYPTWDVNGQRFYFTGVNTLAWCATSGSPAYCSP
jgi:hypothetical protein